VTPSFHLEALAPGHDRTSFSCGVAALDEYLRNQATQDVRRRASACYVAVEAADSAPGGAVKVAGYYTLAAGGVPLTGLPPALAKRLPRYPSVPVARMGRLAVDRAYQGRKLGAALLTDAALRALRSEVAVFAMVVDAKDAAAERFYLHHGFERYGSEPRRLIVPLGRFANRG
jgi:ribosomal protein S18 acetylase RimI-like enzyme